MSLTQVSAVAEEAHRQTVKTSIAQIAVFLKEGLGQKLVAHMAGVSDPKTVGRWAAGEQTPRAESEAKLRLVFQVFQMLQTRDSPHTVRAWFLGLNPQLNDEAPATAISEGRLREVGVAAKSYLSGG